MPYSITHAANFIHGIEHPHWNDLQKLPDGSRQEAIRIAHQYVMDHGGYVCVKDDSGLVIYGTDPRELDEP